MIARVSTGLARQAPRSNRRFHTVRRDFLLLPRFICLIEGQEPSVPNAKRLQAINHRVMAAGVAKPSTHRYGRDAVSPARAGGSICRDGDGGCACGLEHGPDRAECRS
jgi:hypothetical protein